MLCCVRSALFGVLLTLPLQFAHWRECKKWLSLPAIVFSPFLWIRIQNLYALLCIESRHPLLWAVVIIHLVRSLVNLVRVRYLQWLPLLSIHTLRTTEKKESFRHMCSSIPIFLEFNIISICHLYYISAAWIELSSIQFRIDFFQMKQFASPLLIAFHLTQCVFLYSIIE